MKKQSKKKVAVCGCFGGRKGKNIAGQETKTINLFKIADKLSFAKKIDTFSIRWNFLFILIKIIFLFFWCDTFFLCTSRNGIKKILPLLVFLRKIKFKKTSILYFCVGTCPLPSNFVPGGMLLKKDIKIRKYLKQCSQIFAETQILADEISKQFNLVNVSIYKNYQINKDPISYNKNKHSFPLKMVYFSRITKKKNYHFIFEALNCLINSGRNNFYVDFYGIVDENEKKFFFSKIDNKNFFYKGIISQKFSNDILSKYDFLLFTTSFLEGTPGTIIDAYFANIPILSQPFWACDELVRKPDTGIISNDFFNDLIAVYDNPFLLLKKVDNIYKMALSYSSKYAIDDMKNILIRF